MATVLATQEMLPDEDKSNGIRSLAIRIYREKGDSHDLAKIIRDAIQDDESLVKDAIWFASRQLAMYARSDFRRGRNGVSKTRDVERPDASGPRIFSDDFLAEMREGYTKIKFLSWPLMDGSKLADADKEKLVANANQHHMMAATNARNAHFLRIIAADLPKGRKVSDAFTENDLADFMDRAVKESSGMG